MVFLLHIAVIQVHVGEDGDPIGLNCPATGEIGEAAAGKGAISGIVLNNPHPPALDAGGVSG